MRELTILQREKNDDRIMRWMEGASGRPASAACCTISLDRQAYHRCSFPPPCPLFQSPCRAKRALGAHPCPGPGGLGQGRRDPGGPGARVQLPLAVT